MKETSSTTSQNTVLSFWGSPKKKNRIPRSVIRPWLAATTHYLAVIAMGNLAVTKHGTWQAVNNPQGFRFTKPPNGKTWTNMSMDMYIYIYKS